MDIMTSSSTTTMFWEDPILWSMMIKDEDDDVAAVSADGSFASLLVPNNNDPAAVGVDDPGKVPCRWLLEPTPIQEHGHNCNIVQGHLAEAESFHDLTTKLSRYELNFLKTTSPQAAAGVEVASANNNKMLPQDRWLAQYKELIAFFQVHGHSNVPMNYPPNPRLSHWVKRQRCAWKKKQQDQQSSLTQEREDLLSRLDFTWNMQSDLWHRKFRLLLAFQRSHGHCNVKVRNIQDDPSGLGIWVKCQRRQYRLAIQGKRSFLDGDRVRLLESIGFDWSPSSTARRTADASSSSDTSSSH